MGLVNTDIATLNATAAAADATIADLAKRIKRHDAEIKELDTLVTAGSTGTLDVAANVRAATFTAYTAAGGVYLTAQTAKNLAEAAVVLQVMTTDAVPIVDINITEGGLAAAVRTTKAALDLAVGAASSAADDLTSAIADIQGLRTAVKTKSDDWDEQQVILEGL
jgi:hypothetical protein